MMNEIKTTDEEPLLPTNNQTQTSQLSCLRSLWTQEDWCAVWIGLVFFLAAAILVASGTESPTPVDLHKNSSNPLESWSAAVLATLAPTYFSLVLITMLALHGMGRLTVPFAKIGIHVLFCLALLSKWIASAEAVAKLGLGAAVWSILIGMLLGNLLFPRELPVCLRANKPDAEPSCCDELFIKCNVVMLAVNISSIVSIGLRGVLVSCVDTPLVLLAMAYLGPKLCGIEQTDAIILGAATSICGTSAAVAAATVRETRKTTHLSLFYSTLFPLFLIFFKFVTDSFLLLVRCWE
jgi:hypothetical protein